jgi:acetyl/propionyl-CoA carboxylase alpha subunit
VTELITGIDLVEQMIRVPLARSWPITQDDESRSTAGRSRSRVYAEDPYRGFLPSTGRLTRYRPPVEGAGFRLTTRGASHVARVLPAHMAQHATHLIEKVPPDLSRYLICPMPGLLVSLNVKEGDKVEAGQPLAVIEAMKMENILRAEKTGVVKAVNATAGESLAVDSIILELE